MRLFTLRSRSKKKEEIKKSGRFSDFFLHASEEEKNALFEEVARRANEDQRELLRRANVEVGT